MPRQLDARLSLSVRQETYDRIKKRAEQAGLKPHEWARAALLRTLDFDPDLFILLREVVATRLDTRLLLREQLQYGKLTTERFSFLMTESNQSKEEVAQKVLAEGRRAANSLPQGDDE
jgi:hypothetical protein